MKNNRTLSLLLCAVFSALIVICTYIRIDLGVIAFTMQSLAVLLAAVLLGPANGTAAVGVYIALGLLGLPVFTSGGGIGSFLSPSFGFVIGFLLMAFVCGKLSRRLGNSFKSLLAATAAGTFSLYIFGITYGYFILNVYMSKGMGIVQIIWTFAGMFIPVDLAKCIIVSLLGKRLIPIINR